MPAVKQEEADLVFNRANVALARSQRLIASWLPPPAADSSTSKKAEEADGEEDEIFVPVPEKLGLGAPVSQKKADGECDRSELGSNDKLRKHLLGNSKRKSSKLSTLVPAPKENAFQMAGSSETETEEESRSSLGKRKRRDVAAGCETRDMRGEPHETDGIIGTRRSRAARRGTSYLDELLSKRSNKKRGKDNAW